jgi:L-iditol 2-dehydrogenase
VTRRALVVERPALLPGPDEVVVRPRLCGVCGTDLEILRGEVDPAFVRYPVTIGHEWAGVVEAVGRDVTDVEPGDPCVGEGIVPCGRCPACLAGATNTCAVYDELGFTREGGASDQVLVPARLVHRLADGVPFEDAALVEPASVVVRALEKAGPPAGVRVVVVGDGTIALLAVLFVQLWSPREVTVVGRRREQEALARAAGATRFTLDESDVEGVDLAVEAAGAVEAVQSAVRLTRRGGTVVLLGLPPAGRPLGVAADLLVNNDLTLSASFGYTSAAWARTVELVNSRAVRPGVLVTHRYPLDCFAQAFAQLAEPRGARGKVMLEITTGDARRDPRGG